MLKDILNELNESNSSNYKLDILKKYKDNSELKKLLELTYNRNKYNFNVSKNCIIKDNPNILESNGSKTVDELLSGLEILGEGTIRGNEAHQFVCNHLKLTIVFLLFLCYTLVM